MSHLGHLPRNSQASCFDLDAEIFGFETTSMQGKGRHEHDKTCNSGSVSHCVNQRGNNTGANIRIVLYTCKYMKHEICVQYVCAYVCVYIHRQIEVITAINWMN